MCKRENEVGTRFCRNCGRLLVERYLPAPDSRQAPLYEGEIGLADHWAGGELADAKSARVVIRAIPAETEDLEDAIAQRVGEYALEGRTITIGRGQNCEIVFADDSMTSRRHAILRCDANHYTVADLGSSNGTFLNDLEVREPTPLNHGDRILIGQHELLFLLDQPRAIVPQEQRPEAVDAAIDAMADAQAESLPHVGAHVSAQARPTAGPARATAKHTSVARLSSELAASASRMVAPQQDGIELDSIRTRLVEASEALTRQAGVQAALAERRRAALMEARERLTDLIADLRGDDVSGDSPTHQPQPSLIELVSRVADDPNDMERLRTLSSRAGELAQALRAQGPSEGQWSYERAQTLRILEDIRLRLQEQA
jgi:hypothetical protein